MYQRAFSPSPAIEMVELQSRMPLILIASRGEWIGRSVESVLELSGYSVLRVEEGRGALDVARHMKPDALVLDCSLADMGGIEVCQALVDDPLFDAATPIFITSPAPVSNRMRSDAYQAGAWDFCTQPLDVELLLLKMGTFLRARRRLEEVQRSSLIDPLTGLYSVRGLQHWAERLGARAARKHEPFACVAVTASTSHGGSLDARPASAAISFLANICRTYSRKSDVVGYVGESRFAILAPETDEAGARQFVGRLRRAIEKTGISTRREPEGVLHAGFCAVSDFSAVSVEPADLVRRAASALEYAQLGAPEGGALSFDELPG
jgi:PleD family two-component response regulator